MAKPRKIITTPYTSWTVSFKHFHYNAILRPKFILFCLFSFFFSFLPSDLHHRCWVVNKPNNNQRPTIKIPSMQKHPTIPLCHPKFNRQSKKLLQPLCTLLMIKIIESLMLILEAVPPAHHRSMFNILSPSLCIWLCNLLQPILCFFFFVAGQEMLVGKFIYWK